MCSHQETESSPTLTELCWLPFLAVIHPLNTTVNLSVLWQRPPRVVISFQGLVDSGTGTLK